MSRGASEIQLGFIRPELPTLVSEPPTDEGWIHEIKYDGDRTLVVIDRGQVRAFTRHGNDWTVAYRRVVDACSKLTCETALIDGEMVVQDAGITDFHALRSAIYTAPHRIALFAFDPQWPGSARASPHGAPGAPRLFRTLASTHPSGNEPSALSLQDARSCRRLPHSRRFEESQCWPAMVRPYAAIA